MSMGEMLRIIDHQYVPRDIEPIKEIFNSGCKQAPSSFLWALAKVYTYGVIMGKREERACRRRQTASYNGVSRPAHYWAGFYMPERASIIKEE